MSYREILQSLEGAKKVCITLKFDRHFRSSAAEVPEKFHFDQTILNKIEWLPGFAGSYSKISYRILKQGPDPM